MQNLLKSSTVLRRLQLGEYSCGERTRLEGTPKHHRRELPGKPSEATLLKSRAGAQIRTPSGGSCPEHGQRGGRYGLLGAPWACPCLAALLTLSAALGRLAFQVVATAFPLRINYRRSWDPVTSSDFPAPPPSSQQVHSRHPAAADGVPGTLKAPERGAAGRYTEGAGEAPARDSRRLEARDRHDARRELLPGGRLGLGPAIGSGVGRPGPSTQCSLHLVPATPTPGAGGTPASAPHGPRASCPSSGPHPGTRRARGGRAAMPGPQTQLFLGRRRRARG